MKQQSYRNFFLIICGPTGSGKTDLSYQVAQRFPVEIINCDVGQFYTPLTIGTAKPLWQESPLPHHLFDCIDQPMSMTVKDYRERVIEIMQDIWQRGALPVIVGGSLFYVRSLFFPPKEVARDSTLMSEPITSTVTTIDLWQQLQKIDPERAAKIDKNDRYRIERALAIWSATGCLPSQHRPAFDPIAPYFNVTCVMRNREELYARINERVHHMFNDGWVQEVADLSPAWKDFLLRKKILGYPEIIRCLERHDVKQCCTNKELITELQKITRNYAKRQMTFWRSLKRDIEKCQTNNSVEELDLASTSAEAYINNIQQSVNNFMRIDRERG